MGRVKGDCFAFLVVGGRVEDHHGWVGGSDIRLFRSDGQTVIVLLGGWGHGCRQLQPRYGARRFGAWAFIRHAQIVVGMERYGHSNQLGSFTCVDPHQRWGHA